LQDTLLIINGTAGDPLAQALAESKAFHECEEQLRKEEVEHIMQSLTKAHGQNNSLHRTSFKQELPEATVGDDGSPAEKFSEAVKDTWEGATCLPDANGSSICHASSATSAGGADRKSSPACDRENSVDCARDNVADSSEDSSPAKRPRKGLPEPSVGSAGAEAGSDHSGHTADIEVLVDMGFDRCEAVLAMRDANGDVEMAAAILLSAAGEYSQTWQVVERSMALMRDDYQASCKG